jgi:hypothetical protein
MPLGKDFACQSLKTSAEKSEKYFFTPFSAAAPNAVKGNIVHISCINIWGIRKGNYQIFLRQNLPLKEMNAHCVKYVKIRRIG